MAPEMKRPILKDVAALAGVSLKTASRVINDEPFVSDELTARVNAAVRELGYRRDHLASRLKGEKRTSTVGLVVADVSNPFFSVITRAVENRAVAEGHLLATVSSDENPRREREIIDRLVQRRIDGLLIASARRDHRFLRREMDQGMAIVFFDRPPVSLAADAVLIDNCRGAVLAVKHLVGRGHRRIALLSDTEGDTFTARERFRGYRQVLAEAGLSLDDQVTRFGLHDPEHARQAVTSMLERPMPPTAFFATNNRTAVGAAQALADLPEIGLVGFDDFELAAALRRPVSVISYDLTEMAHQAAELLFQRLGGLDASPRTVIVPTSLVVRDT